MLRDLFMRYGIKQLGFYVEDLEKASVAFSEALGAGPFFDLGTSEPQELFYRGNPSNMRSRCALGQLADMQIELIEVLTDEPDVYKEMGHYGLHHMCIWVDDVEQAKNELLDLGFEIAMELTSGQGLQVLYFDCRELLGCYLEINAPIQQLALCVAEKSFEWTGEKPFRPISELLG